MNDQIQNDDLEKCHFCANLGLYWGMNENKIVSLCKKHVVLEASS